MTDYQMIGYRLINYPGVSAITTKIYHGDIPEGVTYPCINYFLVSRPQILEGVAERPRYQISCWAIDPGVVMDLADQVHAAFNNLQNTINGFDLQMSTYDNSIFFSDGGVYHVAVDIFISYIN